MEKTDKITTEQAIEFLGIKKSEYYARLKKLNLKLTHENGKNYLLRKQIKLLKSTDGECNSLSHFSDEQIALLAKIINEESAKRIGF